MAPAVAAPSPVHDYTARDWTALRQALLEFHVRQHPDADISVADPAVAIIELFAHLGDVLHYRIDRVGTEAYLATARDRTSMRRHARLLDYDVADAVAAATTVHGSVAPGAGTVSVHAGDRVRPDDDVDLAFTIDDDLDARDALGEIAVYDWGETACCLAGGRDERRPGAADPGRPSRGELARDRRPARARGRRSSATSPPTTSGAGAIRIVPWPQVDGSRRLPRPLAQSARRTW